MKNKIYLVLLFSICLFVSCEPETTDDNPVLEDIIFIPDEIFKNTLVNTNTVDTNNDGIGDIKVDTNNDGEIQRSEAERIGSLILTFDSGSISRYVDLTGIENFVNITKLYVKGPNIYSDEENTNPVLLSYDLTNLKKLEYLKVSNLGSDYFENIDLSGLNNLVEVNLPHNRPTFFRDTDYKIPLNYITVKMEGATNLKKLSFLNSFLKVDFCQVPSLKELDMHYLEGGEPEVFDFHCLTQLEWLDISDNLIERLILKNSSVLQTLIANDIGSASEFTNYPFLKYICIDDIPEEHNQISTLKNENTVVITDC